MTGRAWPDGLGHPCRAEEARTLLVNGILVEPTVDVELGADVEVEVAPTVEVALGGGVEVEVAVTVEVALEVTP